MSLSTRLSLLDGNSIPQLGFGTWKLQGETAYECVFHALSIGVRHIDTAAVYNNEREVGKAVSDAGLAREDLFITSKVWNEDQGYDSTISACHDSLERLDLDYLDLYLVHWPITESRIETYKALETLQRDGVVRSIGVSNFITEHLEELLEETSVTPVVNQLELHPFNYQQRAAEISLCQENDILIEAYSPLVQGQKFNEPVVQQLAKKHKKEPAHILLKWSISHGFVVLPRSSNKQHITSNYDLFDFDLDDSDMLQLDELNENLVTTMSPERY